MDTNELKTLYEDIMREVRRHVIRRINETCIPAVCDEYELLSPQLNREIDDWLDDIEHRLEHLSAQQIKNLNESNATTDEMAYFASNYMPSFLIESFREDAEHIAEELVRRFYFDDWRVFIKTLDGPEGKDSVEYKFMSFEDEHEPLELIDVIVNASSGEQTTVNEFMNACGYTLIRTMKSKASTEFYDICGVHLVYAPTNPKPATDDVLTFDRIYHVTSLDSLRKIRTEGLVPQYSEGREGIYYPERLYFFLDRQSAVQWRDRMANTHQDQHFFILAVDTSDIPLETVFYYDSLTAYKKAVFTSTPIPPDVLYVADK